MKLLFLFINFNLLFLLNLSAQDTIMENLPYRQIPDYPENYTPETVAARMIDGLGFRFYWATEGLRESDLNYKPSAEGRTSLETIEHIYQLSKVIVNTTTNSENIIGTNESLKIDELRRRTLENLLNASDILTKNEGLNTYNITFESEKETVNYPFWNLINGPIADALWHTGQVVLLRRASGNPFNSKVSVFTGKLRE